MVYQALIHYGLIVPGNRRRGREDKRRWKRGTARVHDCLPDQAEQRQKESRPYSQESQRPMVQTETAHRMFSTGPLMNCLPVRTRPESRNYNAASPIIPMDRITIAKNKNPIPIEILRAPVCPGRT